MADTKIGGMEGGDLGTSPAGTEEVWAQAADGLTDYFWSASSIKTWCSASPTLVTPDLGTPSAGVMTNVTGTASGLTAGNVTTNANLTGHVTSVGNAAVLGTFTTAQLITALSDASTSLDELAIHDNVSGEIQAIAEKTAPVGADLLIIEDSQIAHLKKRLTIANLHTNATLVAPALGTPASGVLTNATGLPVTGLANGTDGELITWGADAVATTVGAGTSGQVLTSNGAGAAPTFQAAAGGGGAIEYITSESLSGASSYDYDLTTSPFTLATDEQLVIVLENVTFVTDDVYCGIRVSTDSGSSFVATTYAYHQVADGASQSASTTSGVMMYLCCSTAGERVGNASNEALCTTMKLSGLRKAVKTRGVSIGMNNDAAGNVTMFQIASQQDTAATVTDIRLISSSGNFNGGNAHFYREKVS